MNTAVFSGAAGAHADARAVATASGPSIVDTLPCAALLVDGAGTVAQASAPAHRLLRWGQGELVGQALGRVLPAALWHADDVAASMTALSAAGAQEIDARGGDGRRLRLLVSASRWPVDGPGGRPRHVLCLEDRTTSWQQAGQMLMQARLINHTPEAVVVVDDRHAVVAWNEASSRLFGIGAERAIGQPLTGVLPLPDHDRLLQALQWLDQGAIGEMTLQAPLAAGSGVTATDVLLTLVRMAALPGIGACTVLYAMDVSGQRRTEAALHAALDRANRQGERLIRLGRHSLDLARQVGSDRLRRCIVDGLREVLDAQAAVLVEGADDAWQCTESPVAEDANTRWPWDAPALRHRLDAAWRDGLPLVEPAPSPRENDASGTAASDATGWLAVPLLDGPRVAGQLRVLAAPGRRFTQDDLAIALQLAQSAGAMLASHTMARRLQDERERQLTLDPLTGLPNRLLVQDRLRQTLAYARRTGHAAALLMIDIDDFCSVNDAFGYDVGDEMLRETAQRLQRHLREGDTLARLGADTFVLLLPEIADAGALTTQAQTIIDAMGAPCRLAGQELHVSCSIGLATTDDIAAGSDGEDAATRLLQHAHAALTAAKRAGGHGVQRWGDADAGNAAHRITLRSELQQAIEAQDFALHFQPQFDLGSGRLCGVEALVRWRHAQQGLLDAAQFIPLAEQTGQVVAIGHWALEEACRTLKGWLDRGVLDVPVAVNVSAAQFRRPGFVDQVAQALRDSGLPASRLELELTESALADPGPETIARMDALRALGVGLSIDDFGTGLSRLSSLRHCPVDKVKIDRSFVRGIANDSDEASITLSIIAIAHHLRLRVIAEGVETPAQVAYLRRHLCDEIQGHVVGHPMPAHAFVQFLAQQDQVRELLRGGPSDERPVLLLVDDEPNVLRALTRTLRRDGYRILTAGSGPEAFELLAQHEVDVIMSDQRMPEMSGTEFLGQVKAMHPQTVRIILSGYTDLGTVTEAINRGAIYRFLTKPWDDEQLRAHVREALQHGRRLRQAMRR